MPDYPDVSNTTPVDLARALAIQARANRLANRRLQNALSNLSTSELHARRTSFFPSLIGTLNHILAVDLYYIAALHGEADAHQQYHRFAPQKFPPVGIIGSILGAILVLIIIRMTGLERGRRRI